MGLIEIIVLVVVLELFAFAAIYVMRVPEPVQNENVTSNVDSSGHHVYSVNVSDYATYAESMIRQISLTRVMSDSLAYSERLVKSIGISLYDYVEYGENVVLIQAGKTFVYLYDSITYAEDVLNSAFTAFTSTVVQMPYVSSVSDVFVFTSDNGLIWGVTVGLLGMAYLYSRRKPNTQDEETLREEFGNDNEE